MYKTFGLTLATIIAVMLMTTVNPNYYHVNSAQVTTQRASHRRQQRIQIGHTIYIINDRQPTRQLTAPQIRVALHQFKAQTLHDVKLERARDLAPSIKPSRKLDHLASLRARQVAKRFSHYSRNHQPMTTLDARQADLPRGFQASENIASASLGNCTVIGDPKTYHNHNGRDMANMSNDGMMNYDALENNGHRRNILSSDNTLIGVGVAYSYHKHEFYLAEDFGSRNPHSSADVTKPRLKIHLKAPQRLTTAQQIGHRVISQSRYYTRQLVRWLHEHL